MSKDRRQYSEEFKREAVRLMTEGGVPLAQVSRDLGVCTSVLGNQCAGQVEARCAELGFDHSASYWIDTGLKGQGVSRSRRGP